MLKLITSQRRIIIGSKYGVHVFNISSFRYTVNAFRRMGWKNSKDQNFLKSTISKE